MFAILFFLASLIVLQTLPAPPNGGKQEKPSQEKHAVSNASPSPTSLPIVQNQGALQKVKTGSKNEEPQKEKSFWGDLPAWLLVIVGGLAA
jgi:hypothetical protein